MDNKELALMAIQLRGWKNGQLTDLVTAALDNQPVEHLIEDSTLKKLGVKL